MRRMPFPVAGAAVAVVHWFTDGLAGKAAVEAAGGKCLGVFAGTFGAGAAVAGVYEAKARPRARACSGRPGAAGT